MISLIYELIDSIDRIAAALVWFVPANDSWSASVSCCSQSRLCYRENGWQFVWETTRDAHFITRFLRSFSQALCQRGSLNQQGKKSLSFLFAVRSCIHPVLCCVQRISIRAHFSRYSRPICPRSILRVKKNIFLPLVFLKSDFKAFASVLIWKGCCHPKYIMWNYSSYSLVWSRSITCAAAVAVERAYSYNVNFTMHY